MHLSSHNTEQQLRALVFILQSKTLYICTPEELPVSDFVCSGFTIEEIHRLKSGLQASSLSSPLKIGQSPEAAWNLRLSKLASC